MFAVTIRRLLSLKIAVIFPLILGLLGVCSTSLAESSTATEPSIEIPDDMSRRMFEEAAYVKAQFHEQARTLFSRTPVGFDFDTLKRVQRWFIRLPMALPGFVEKLHEQSRLLGFVGSMIVLAFLIVLLYSLIGRKRVFQRLESSAKPLTQTIPDNLLPIVQSVFKIIAASLLPALLLGTFYLVKALTTYEAAGFLVIGHYLTLWTFGALIITSLQELLTRDHLPIPPHYGITLFRISRIVVLFILVNLAIFNSAKVFNLPSDILALIKFLINLAIVFSLVFLMFKKEAILGILPDLPYSSYQILTRGFKRLYTPVMAGTFITGLLWSFGYHALCKFIWIKTWAVLGYLILMSVVYHYLWTSLKQWHSKKDDTDETAQLLYRALRSVVLLSTVTITVLGTLQLLGLFSPLQRIISFTLLKIGNAPLSLWTIFKALFILLIFIYLSKLIRAYFDYKIFPSVGLEEGLAYSINTIIGYFLIILGFIYALKVIGLDLRFIMIFAGAIGIGIGFGLQNLASNFVSGFIIIFGRKIRKGDWIQVGDTLGFVQEVTLRATKVRTRDNVEYLIPNSDLTANTIVNHTLSDPEIRIHIPVGVTYKANPVQVTDILLTCAHSNSSISKRRKPNVWFKAYGESSIDFVLLVWIDVRKISEEDVKSQLYYAIFSALADAGIEIPFPQRDLHIRSDATKNTIVPENQNPPKETN
ncbi:mechanosensitive ion channel [bacterium]|nr:mechanosensitive ion channel [candidate division CSSED10-310 bacterium]